MEIEVELSPEQQMHNELFDLILRYTNKVGSHAMIGVLEQAAFAVKMSVLAMLHEADE